MMIRYFSFLFFVLLGLGATIPSKYVSRTGHLHVESHSTYLDVIADNYQVYCEVTPATGVITIKGLTKSFEFKLGALDRAFNSDRVNMTQFAKFDYKGKITNLNQVDFTRPGSYTVTVDGTLHIGSFKRLTKANGLLVVGTDGTIKTDTSFKIRIEEESVQTINRLMKEKLPSLLALDADRLGVSRDIQLKLNASFRPRG